MARNPIPAYQVRRSPIQGKGAFATRTIRKGTRVTEYVGERISQEESNRRYRDFEMKRHHTFLFAVDSKTCIDGAVGGNDSRYFNHSCDPNCEAINEGGRIFIYTTKTVREGEELTYDYRYIVDDNLTEEELSLYRCKCGTDNCRGTIANIRRKRRSRAS